MDSLLQRYAGYDAIAQVRELRAGGTGCRPALVSVGLRTVQGSSAQSIAFAAYAVAVAVAVAVAGAVAGAGAGAFDLDLIEP
ncbi:hypothetical protein [Luteimonas sp. 3794]|uniref:hypothetical protein n=1 Tax=Luteimonas sp. 3794 TaxID=2817730 RepID=UPI002855ECD8|nr:hypothetical protein [Luteimonas sp. 3794]MDR6991961.1 hypothetical protein [Luteimonas sp. 3794]